MDQVREKRQLDVARPTGSLCEGLCNCCLKFPRQVAPSIEMCGENLDLNIDYKMIETQPKRKLRVIHTLPYDNPVDNKKTRSKRNHGNGKKGAMECDSGNSLTGEPISSPAVDSVVVSAEINNIHETNDTYMYANNVSVMVNDNEDCPDVIENDFTRKHSVRVYDFESPFHPNNRCFLRILDGDKHQRLQTYSDRLAKCILIKAMQTLSGIRQTFESLDVRLSRANSEIFYMNFSISRSNLNLEKLSCKEACNGNDLRHINQVFQECDVLDGDTKYKDKSASNVTVYSNLASSGFHSLSKRFAGITNNESGVAVDEYSQEFNCFDPLENFTYSPSGNDDNSSQMGSSFQSSTWGSSTNSSLRYMRRFVSKKYKTKPMLFFIHGIGDSADLWRNQMKFFRQKGYETLAMDLVGHGLSYAPDLSKVYRFHSILADVIAIFDRYSKERNVAIGHSYGACFAAALARRRTKQVTHLVLLSGGGPYPLCPQPSKLYERLCRLSCIKWWSTSLKSRRRAYCIPSRKQTTFISSLDIPSYVRRHICKGQVWLEGGSSFHKQITAPTLLIYGLRDPFITLVEECEMEKTIPRAFLELIPEASHMIMLDTPHEVNDMIYKFLKRWDG